MKKKEKLLLMLSIISLSISITPKIKKHLGEKKNVEPINISLKEFMFLDQMEQKYYSTINNLKGIANIIKKYKTNMTLKKSINTY